MNTDLKNEYVYPSPPKNIEDAVAILERLLSVNKRDIAWDAWVILHAEVTKQPRVERYGDGVLVHWPDGTTSQYLEAGDCVTAAPQPQAAPVAWAMADQLDDKLMIGFSVVRTGHPDQKRGHFTVPLYAAATQPPKVQK